MNRVGATVVGRDYSRTVVPSTVQQSMRVIFAATAGYQRLECAQCRWIASSSRHLRIIFGQVKNDGLLFRWEAVIFFQKGRIDANYAYRSYQRWFSHCTVKGVRSPVTPRLLSQTVGPLHQTALRAPTRQIPDLSSPSCRQRQSGSGAPMGN